MMWNWQDKDFLICYECNKKIRKRAPGEKEKMILCCCEECWENRNPFKEKKDDSKSSE